MQQRVSLLKRRRYRQQGLSLVELLVGVVVGLFLVGGAIKLTVDTVNNNRRALLETRVSQDLRAAADLVARDLRRAGYWDNSLAGIWGSIATTPVPNPHRQVTAATGNLGTLDYSYAKNADNVPDANEQHGFRVSSNVLQYQLDVDPVTGSNWQAITDPNSVLIDNDGFQITQTTRLVELFSYCSCITQLKCSAADFTGTGTYVGTRPTLTVREFGIRIKGTSASDTRVQREVRESVRVRNDLNTGSCPTIP